VKTNEIFGFLGTNGAGKTTTMSVLSGEFLPTRGRGLIAGFDVVHDRDRARQNLGYCPQFDALLDHMTPTEHLTMFARIRGIAPELTARTVDQLLTALSLQEYKDRIAMDLSGGNKRKLSVAIALVGGPPVVFLDEPSAGMDPYARRGLWKAIEASARNRCVVLTTHHLEEVEALAHRVAIMVDGKLVCIGSLQHLKNKFGKGYEMQIKVSLDYPDALIETERFITSTFAGAEKVETHGSKLTFEIPRVSTSLAKMFAALDGVRNELHIVDYSIAQTSIEQVFIRVSGQTEAIQFDS